MNKLPPNEPEVEKTVIVSILLDGDYRKKVFKSLTAGHFYSTSNQIIFAKIKDLHKNGHSIASDTIWAGLDDKQKKTVGGIYELEKLKSSEPVSTDIGHHISILKDRYARRQAWQFANAIDKKCHTKSDLIEIQEIAQSIVTAVQSSKPQSDRTAFEFAHSGGILENLKPIEWRIHGIMEDKIFYCSFGEVGHFKTFLELDRLLCIAAGIDYHGHRVKQGPVFFVAAEGLQGLGRRIAAWHAHHGTSPADVPFFISSGPTQLMDLNAVRDVKAAVDLIAVEYGPTAVIHFDTLARNFGAGDENSTRDMGQVVNNLDITFGNDVCIGLTHHTGHRDKTRGRGSTVLKASIDAEYRAEYQNNLIRLSCTKMKDAPQFPPMIFSKKEILLQIGNEKDSSYVLELEPEGDDACFLSKVDEKKTSGNMLDALELLKEMYAECEKNLAGDGRPDSMPHISKKEWRNVCIVREIYKRSDSFEKAVKRMFKRGLLQFDNAQYHVYPIEIIRKYKSDDFELA